MFRSYYLKWCFLLISILVISTMLIRPDDRPGIMLSQYIGHAVSLTVYLLTSWLIHAWFRIHHFPGLSNNAKVTISISLGIIITTVMFYISIHYVPGRFFLDDMPAMHSYFDIFKRIIASFLLNMICLVVFSVVYTNSILQKTQLENEQLKQAHLRAQLISLQQQISPHFLFNSLSTLKTIAKDIDTKKFVVQLSHVYRYLLNYNEHNVTRLENELSFIKSYLYILHWRFEESLRVTINIPEMYNHYLIPPVSLQLLIENVIKHNVLSPELPLDIHIAVDKDNNLRVTNTLQPKKMAYESTKLGLQNIKDRFRLLFNKEIVISSTGECFSVILPLISHEHYNH